MDWVGADSVMGLRPNTMFIKESTGCGGPIRRLRTKGNIEKLRAAWEPFGLLWIPSLNGEQILST